MKKAKSLSVFLLLLLLSTTFLFAAENISPPAKKTFAEELKKGEDLLNDNARLILQSFLYVLGGVTSGATLLVYFIRRFIKSYDLRFEQYDSVLEKREEKADRILTLVEEIQEKWDERESKIITMIEEIHSNLQDFRIDMTKFEYSTVSKESMSLLITKLAVIENTCALNHKRKIS